MGDGVSFSLHFRNQVCAESWLNKRLSVMLARRHGGGVVAASTALVGSLQFGSRENENPYEVELVSCIYGCVHA
jgi:hypothetical protein